MRGDDILATGSQNIPTREWTPRPARGQTNTPPARQIREVFFDATRDSKSGVIFVKVVNAAATAQEIVVQISGASGIESTGEAVVLAAKGLDETNTLQEPQKIVPHTEKVDGLGANFTREFPAYSVTVLKIRSR
jgi:alpha-N-arabinofuranosidase